MPTQLEFSFDEWMPLELYDKDLVPNTYRPFLTGGKHPFYGVPNTYPIYQELIWPYIKRIHWPGINNAKGGQRADQMNLCVRDHGQPYPYISLTAKGDRTISPKNRNPYVVQRQKFFMMHRLVAMAFVKRPPGKEHVMHLNDDPTNYLASNLRWGTNRENHADRSADSKRTMGDIYEGLLKAGKLKG